MKRIYLLLVLIVSIALLNSCKKNELSATSPDPVLPYTPGSTITTSVAGKILNQSGNPLSGVEITIGSSKVLTDAGGNFIIPKATIGDKVGFIKASKSGYFDGSRTIKPKEKVVNNIVIQMIEKKLSGSFTNANGGSITVQTGGKIEFPSGAVTTKSGTPYSGTVKVSAYYLNPTNEACNREMPGDLRGISSSNNEELLSSFGMMNVELEGSNGEALQIASGKKAIVTFPVDATLIGNSPATIPLWFFDIAKGMWVQEGVATKTGNNYVGEVAHFTWWNCDWGGGPLEIKATFVDQNKNALDNYHVYFVTQGGWGAGGGHGYTASDGTLTGNIPANTTIKMIVKKHFGCNSSWAETTLLDSLIGPFTSNVNLDSVKVNIPNLSATSIRLKGIVNGCGGTAMANGYALIKIGNEVFYDQVTNGVFDKQITFCSSVPNTSATIEFFDIATLNKNLTPVSVNITGAGTYSVGTVSACGIQVAIRYTGIIKDQNGSTPTGFMYVSFGKDSISQGSIQNGNLTATIAANKIVTRVIYYYDQCSGQYIAVDSTQIGPFASDFNAGIITVNIPTQNVVVISGTATTCSNTNVSNGTAIVNIDGSTYQASIINGSYSLSVTRCNAVQTNASITVVDNTANQQNNSPVSVTVSNANVTVPNIQACGVSSLQNFNYTLNGVNYTCSLNSADSTAIRVFPNTTELNGSASPPNYHNIYLSSFGKTLGTFGITNISVNASNNFYYSDSSTSANTITFTEFGTVGQIVAGTFSGKVRTQNSSTLLTINGSFRLRRK